MKTADCKESYKVYFFHSKYFEKDNYISRFIDSKDGHEFYKKPKP